MPRKSIGGALDIIHVLGIITIISIAIAVLVPLHGNINSLMESFMYEYEPQPNPNILVNVQNGNNTAIITITIKNENNNQDLTISGLLINGYKCYLTSNVVIPPDSAATLTLESNPPVLVSINGAYTTGVIHPALTCYPTTQTSNNYYLGLIVNNTIAYAQING